MNLEKNDISAIVGRVLSIDQTRTLGSCFPISSTGYFITCFHVIGNTKSGKIVEPSVIIEWPYSGRILRVKVDVMLSSPEIDIAVLVSINKEDYETFAYLPIDARFLPESEFLSFGFRKTEEFLGLFTEGRILGKILAVGGISFLQLKSKDISHGMSGAPVIDKNYKHVVGIISDYWHTTGMQDSELALAVPFQEIFRKVPSIFSIIPQYTSQPKHITKEASSVFLQPFKFEKEFCSMLISAAALLLVDQFADGAWARTLWRSSGNELTKDFLDPELLNSTKTKKAISITSWAGQCLYKITGNNRLKSITKAKEFIESYWNYKTGAFGFLYNQRINIPIMFGKENVNIFIGNPRHTASAAKFLEITEGLSQKTIDSISFILGTENREGGGWGEYSGDASNCLSSAFIIDFFAKIKNVEGLTRFITPGIHTRLNASLNRGISWLAETQDPETGFWTYIDNKDLCPFYTIHVLVFAPELANTFPSVTENSISALLKLSKNGGIPKSINGKPEISATSMFAYALSKIDPIKYSSQINDAVLFVLDKFNAEVEGGNISVYETIFILMLGQLSYINRIQWVKELNDFITKMEDILFKEELSQEIQLQYIRTLLLEYNININNSLDIIQQTSRN